MKRFATIAAACALTLGTITTAASAQSVITRGSPSIASYYVRGMCLDVRASDRVVLLWTCHGGANQAFRFVSGNYGLISLGNQQCLTAGRTRGASLTAQTCNNGDQAQKWGFQYDGTLRNELGYCADIEGGSRSAGTRIISWNCNAGSRNQLWYPAVTASQVIFGLQTWSAMWETNRRKGSVDGLIGTAGFSGGNMVAAGGGNMVAAGGGNVVMVVGGAGRMIAAGGGNMVAAGGGNVVPTNGGGLLPNSWNFFNGTTAGQLVGNDGASFSK